MARPASDTTWPHWLRQALTKRGWIARDLARTGIASESTISKWLRGENPPKLVDTVIDVAHLLGAPDAIDALEAAGMARAAALIRSEIEAADEDPMIARIRNERTLTPAQREQMEAEFRRTQAETIHYFELRLAEAQRRYRVEHDGRTRGKSDETNGDETRAML
jgi:transcriptional regulator with XRE-family HTH domain